LCGYPHKNQRSLELKIVLFIENAKIRKSTCQINYILKKESISPLERSETDRALQSRNSAGATLLPKILYFCVCIHIYMGTKTLSIRDETYVQLKDAKLEGESFSDVIDRLLKKKKGNLSVYFGALKDEELLEGLEEDSRKIRKLSRFRNDCT
jgi:predicted CopG family antitoxin